VIAHRGVSSLFPENTMPAFMAAINIGCQMIELDVSLTKDGRVVVIHDDTLERTTSGGGRICDTIFDDISGLDAGLKMSDGKIGTHIPLLEDVLKLAKGRIAVNIEIKSEVDKKKWNGKSAEEHILKLVLENEMGKNVIFSSFSTNILRVLRSFSKDIYIGILTYGDPRPPVQYSKELDVFSWHPEGVNLTKKHIAYYKKRTGRKVIPYTLNKKRKIKRLLHAGIDGYFTDFPQNYIGVFHE